MSTADDRTEAERPATVLLPNSVARAGTNQDQRYSCFKILLRKSNTALRDNPAWDSSNRISSAVGQALLARRFWRKLGETAPNYAAPAKTSLRDADLSGTTLVSPINADQI